jgi:hypothetical protein
MAVGSGFVQFFDLLEREEKGTEMARVKPVGAAQGRLSERGAHSQ